MVYAVFCSLVVGDVFFFTIVFLCSGGLWYVRWFCSFLLYTSGWTKSKRIPSIFNDESTESFICLRRHIYMSHVNKVQPIHVKMICIAAIRVTCMKDFLSVVKVLLKAFLFCSLFPYPPQSELHASHRIALPPNLSCNKRHHTYCYVTCSKVNAKSSRTSSDVTIWRCGAQLHTIM
jgi:hypothetical protein